MPRSPDRVNATLLELARTPDADVSAPAVSGG